MKGKIPNILLWILSIFFLLWSLIGLTGTWTSLLFLIPATLFNPIIAGILKRYNFRNRWWISLCAIVVPFAIFIGNLPPASPTTAAPDASSSAIVSSSPAVSSVAPPSSSLAPSSAVSQPVAVATVVPAPESGAKLKVHYIGVGQGDSELLELPNGQTMLIDAGNPENGGQIVSYIKGLGHNKIDYLVATHPHADHIGGMATVVNGLDIGKIYMPKVSTTTQTFEDLLTTVQSKGLKVNTAKAGVNLFKAGNLNADIIAPVNITGDDLNQYSAVIMLTYGDNKFLFMGDAGEQSESQITADVKADVLKVGHHGSNTATSQTFLNKVHPKYAVIEVGKGNSYGHPTAATLSKLQGIGATIYRTDNDGTIIFTSDSHTITVGKKASSEKEQAPPASQKPASQKSTITTQKPSSKVTAPTTQSVTVYITNTGKKYHRDGCRYLSKSKIAISLKDAEARGYTPCSVCDPPQ